MLTNSIDQPIDGRQKGRYYTHESTSARARPTETRSTAAAHTTTDHTAEHNRCALCAVPRNKSS